jgi:hypothetical protein
MRHWSGVGVDDGLDWAGRLVVEGVMVVVTVLGGDEALVVVIEAVDVLFEISVCVSEIFLCSATRVILIQMWSVLDIPKCGLE